MSSSFQSVVSPKILILVSFTSTLKMGWHLYLEVRRYIKSAGSRRIRISTLCCDIEGDGLSQAGIQDFYYEFSRLMCQWEKDFYAQHVLASHASDGCSATEARNRLKHIFNIFVAAGGRNLDRLENLVCGVHPEYDPLNDSVVNIELGQRKAYVFIKKTTGLALNFRLTFVVIDGLVKIKKREFEYEVGKWKSTYI